MQNCADDKYSSFGKYNVQRVENTDGYKYHFDNDQWIMIRASGTEPLLRVYGEASSKEAVTELLQTAKKTLLD